MLRRSAVHVGVLYTLGSLFRWRCRAAQGVCSDRASLLFRLMRSSVRGVGSDRESLQLSACLAEEIVSSRRVFIAHLIDLKASVTSRWNVEKESSLTVRSPTFSAAAEL